jgi:branched-chain amino acid transport system permease protein
MTQRNTLKQHTLSVLLVLAAALLVTLPVWIPSFYLTLTIRIMFFGILAMSFTFLAGKGGMVSLAQVAVFGTSGYALAYTSLTLGLPWFVSIALAIGLSVVLAAVFGLLAVRTSGIYFLMITLALGQIMWGVAFQWVSVTGGFDGLQGMRAPTVLGIDFTSPINFYYVLLVVTIGIVVLLRTVINSPFGLALQGIRDNPLRMQALGYPVTTIRYLAFVLAGFVAAIPGVFFAYFTGVINPGALEMSRSVWILVVTILGGIGSLVGAFLGTTIVVLLETFVIHVTPRYLTVIGLVFLLTILFAPDGITGRFEALLRWLKRSKYGPSHDGANRMADRGRG